MPQLVIDIETIGENFDEMDGTTKEVLTHWIKTESKNESEFTHALQDIKEGLGFSPLTGQIVAIGILDAEKNNGAVYFQSPDIVVQEFTEENIKYVPLSEKEILERFWAVSKNYDQFITYNGRAFDIPYIIVRSAVHKIRPSKDLMSNRYLNSQRGAQHIDLLDQLSFYGAVRKKGSLHLWCRAFGITSPKAQGVTGDDVAALFKNKQYLDIARYNVGDLYATRDVLKYWEKYIKM
jgi:hypothetical protein